MPGVTEILLETLTRGARLAYPYVRAMVEMGLNTTEIQDSLSQMGMGARRTDLLTLIRAERDVQSTRPYLQSVTDDRTINPDRLESPVTTTLRRYSFATEVRGTDTVTGEASTVNVTISSSDLMTPGEIKRAALNLVETAGFRGSKSDIWVGIDPQEAVILSGTDRGF